MNDVQPTPKALLIDWQMHVPEHMDGVILTFLGLPMEGPDPSEARPLAPLAMNLETLRRFQSDVAEVLALIARGSHGQAPTGQQ